jgi:hypothetical protein
MSEQNTPISPGLQQWKTGLESDLRNPIHLENLRWHLPEGISLDPLYDAGSLGPEHAHLQEFHQYWKSCKPHWKLQLKVSSLPASGFTAEETKEAERLGFVAWVGNTPPSGHSLPSENPFLGDPVSESLSLGQFSDGLKKIMAGEIPAELHINSSAFHNAGASPVEDLAYILSLAAHYRELLGDEAFAAMANKIVLHLSTGSSLFLETARLRALRLLWMNFTSKCGLEKLPGNIQAESSLIDWSKTDPDGNLLRHTAAVMASLLGAADALLVNPHSLDPALAMDAIRQSVNLGHLSMEEAQMSKAFDPGSGSYLIETLTHELSKKAWNLFCQWQEISLEEKLRSGFFVKMADAGAQKLRLDFAEGRRVMTGVNKHPSPLSRPCPPWPSENPAEVDFPALKPVFLDA